MATSTATATDAPAASKRASSRVRKQPEHYTSSPFSTNSKRKRDENDEPEADGDADMEDEEESEEDDDPEDDEPAEEELRAKKRTTRKPKSSAPKKPAQKKPKVNGATSLPIRPVAKTASKKAPAKRRVPKKTAAVDAADAEAAGGLYAELFAHGKPFEEAVDGWLKGFRDHESQGLADIINFVLKSAGCDGKVTELDIEDPDTASARLTDLQEEHKATQPTDYPIIAKGKNAGAAFKATISNFMQMLIKSIAAKGMIREEPQLVENMHVWLPVMASATDRAFRHTATVCSLGITTALCEVASELATKSADNQRHADAESKRPRPNKERVKQIEQKAKEASEELETTQEFIKDWFDTVFIHRYRDVDPLIRRDCVEALGEWIITLPDVFFDGNHLRYLGWQLSDENAAVRLEDVKQLRRLYADSDKIGGLRTFTERFRSRMVEIGTSDADTGVRVAGIELLDLLRENDLLEPDDIDAIGRLVFHEEPKVRAAVASFFSASVNDLYQSKVDELGGTESREDSILDPGEGNFEAPRVEWLRFKSLAESLQAYDQEDALPSQVERSKVDGTLVLHAAGVDSRFTLAVDALYDKIEELQEWQALAGHLLFDHSEARANGVSDDALSQLKQASTLTQDEEIILLEVINASVKRSLGDLAEKITGTKSKLTKRQKEDLQEEQEEAVRNLNEVIPKLLKKFGDVPRTAGAVLRLEGVLALPALQGLRHDSAASVALLDDLRKQFMSHATDEVLAPATTAILHAQSYGELDDSAMEKISTLWEDVVGNLAELLNVQIVAVRGASNLEELSALSNNLLRICRLAQVANPITPLEDSSVAANDDSTGKEYHGAIDFIIDLVMRATHSSSDGPAPDPDEAQLEDLVAARSAEAALFYFRWKLLSIMNAVKNGSNADLEMESLEALAVRRDKFVENLEQVLDSRKSNEPISVSVCSFLLELFTSSAVLRTGAGRPGTSDNYTALIMDLDEDRQKAVMKVFVAMEKEFAKLTGKRLEEPVSEAADDEDDIDVDADPIDDDPLSDDESEDETQTQTQGSQAQRKAMKPVLAEEQLCQLTAKIVFAMTAGVLDNPSMRKRLERNKSKLGNNFKEVLNFLDADKKQAKGKAKAKAKPASKAAPAKAAKGSAKSNAMVVDSDHEDEIEDPEEEEEAQREKELEAAEETAQGDGENEDQEMMNGDGEAEAESVMGD